jgi:hypothetical protein
LSPETLPRCESGCPWENHTLDLYCMHQCERCPDGKCKGPWGANLYNPQPRLFFRKES